MVNTRVIGAGVLAIVAGLAVAGCGSGGEGGSGAIVAAETATVAASTDADTAEQVPVAADTTEPEADTGDAAAAATAPDTVPVGPGHVCAPDAMLDQPARIDQGSISCAEARRIVAEYLEVRFVVGTGNTISTVLGNGWGCSSPTAVSSELKQAAVICYNDGDEISIPL